MSLQVLLALPPGWPPASSRASDKEKVEFGNTSRERLHPRPSPPEPQLIPIPMSDGDDAQPPREERQRQRSRSRERVHPHVQVPQVPKIQPKVTPKPDDDVSDEDFTARNPSSPSAGPLPFAPEETNDLDRVSEDLHIHSSHASQQLQPAVPPSGVQQTRTLGNSGRR